MSSVPQFGKEDGECDLLREILKCRNFEARQFYLGQIILVLVPHDHLLQISYGFQHSYIQYKYNQSLP